jgi:hypothetical protein
MGDIDDERWARGRQVARKGDEAAAFAVERHHAYGYLEVGEDRAARTEHAETSFGVTRHDAAIRQQLRDVDPGRGLVVPFWSAEWSLLGTAGSGGAAAASPCGVSGPALPLEQQRLIQLLGITRAENAIPLLTTKLATSSDWTIRLHAVKAIGRIRSAYAVTSLLEAREDPRPEIRGMVAWALGEIGDPETLAFLTAMISDQDELVSWSAEDAASRLIALC